MIDNALIMLGDDITDETVLAALSAVQTFEKNAVDKVNSWNAVHKDNKKSELKIYLICPSRYEFLFKRCLKNVEGIYNDAMRVPKLSYTYITYLANERANKIGINTDKPLAIALGIILGAEAPVLPDVSNLITCHTKQASSILCDPLLSKVSALTNKAVILAQNDSDLEDRTMDVFQAEYVVGYSSYETYLACCLQKPVFEVQLGRGLFKWSNKKYVCITDDSNEEVISKGIDLCLQQAIGK